MNYAIRVVDGLNELSKKLKQVLLKKVLKPQMMIGK